MGTPKFTELRDKRIGVAIDKIQLLGNLRRSSYASTQAELQDIVDALQDQVDTLRETYRLPAPGTAPAASKLVSADVAKLEAAVAAVGGFDREAIKQGTLLVAAGDVRGGLKILRSVILGWAPKGAA